MAGTSRETQSSAALKRRRVQEGEAGGANASASSQPVAPSQAQVLTAEGELACKRAVEDWQAATKAFSGLQAEVKRLEGELDKAKQCREEQDRLLRKEKDALTRELEEVRKGLAAKDELLVEAKAAGARKAEDGNRFHYVLAGSGHSGSIPRSFLESEPESLLNKMYNGEWDYAQDEQGRALVNCHPDRWAAILEHLATGTAPAKQDQQLLDQARHWNLKRLVHALEAITPGILVTRLPDPKGCTAQVRFVKVTEKLKKEQMLNYTFCFPESRWWNLFLDQDGIYLEAVCPPGQSEFPDEVIKANCVVRVLLKERELDFKLDDNQEFEKDHAYGFEFHEHNFSYDELVSEPLARANDCLVVEVDICLD